MNTLIKAICMLAVPIFIHADNSGHGIGPTENTLNNTSIVSNIYRNTGGEVDVLDDTSNNLTDSGNTHGTIGPNDISNFDIFYQLYVMDKTLRKMYACLALLIIMNLFLFLYIYQTSTTINTDKKFVYEQKIMLITFFIVTILLSIGIYVR